MRIQKLALKRGQTLKVFNGRDLWPTAFLFFAICALFPATGFGRSSDLDPRLSAHCYRAIEQVSRQTGVPEDVMLAISLTETGKKIGGRINPWPWTVNMEGAGVWFEGPAEALAYVKTHFQRGARSFDVGCFQINYKWHHEHFGSIEEMFDPLANTQYAARFLTQLYHETGSWRQAAGYYHSRTPEYAQRYTTRFARHLARIAGRDDDPAFVGHGSEPLELANVTPHPPRSKPVWPLEQLGYSAPTEFLSSKPTGSLVRLDGGRSLLTPPKQSLF